MRGSLARPHSSPHITQSAVGGTPRGVVKEAFRGQLRPCSPSGRDLWSWCGVVLELGDGRSIDEIDVTDRDIAASPERDWLVSDLPSDRDVVVYDQSVHAGPSWVIPDAAAERLDATTPEVKHRSGVLNALFELDPTPLDERVVC